MYTYGVGSLPCEVVFICLNNTIEALLMVWNTMVLLVMAMKLCFIFKSPLSFCIRDDSTGGDC